MLHVPTEDGCIWVAATVIVGVRRSGAGHAILRLQDGKVVTSREAYDRFVERLNKAWLSAAGFERSPEPRDAACEGVAEQDPAPTRFEDEIVSGMGLDAVCP